MKKVLALVLAILMLLPVLVACGDNGNGDETTVKPDTTTKPTTPTVTTPAVGDDTDPSTPDVTGGDEPGVTDPGVTEPPVTNPPAAALPEVNYSGETFRVLSKTNSDTATSWGNYEIVYNEEALLVATELKTAIKNRNEGLKNKIGVDITQIDGKSHDNMFSTVRTSVARSQNEYDMVIIGTKQAAQLAQKGYLANVQDDLTYMNLDNDYYDQRAREQLSIKGKNYFFVSDITVVNVDAVWLYYFNHSLIDEYQLENPYTVLSQGKWTIDKLLDMAEKATAYDESNPTKEDNWGIAGHGFVPTSMFFGAGMNIAKADASGNITLTMNDSRITEFMDKVTDILPYWARYSIHGSGDPFGFVAGDNYPQLVAMYAAGRTLFMGEVLAFSRDTSLAATGEDLNIGMLPTPKLNETQAEYYTPVTSSVATVTCVPLTACGNDVKKNDGKGLEKASIIIEYWAKESQNTVMKTYMEQCQKSRYSKDEISAEVIEDIFNAISYDLGDAFGWGSLTVELQKILYEGDTDFDSMYKEKSPKAQSDIDDFVKMFK